MPNWTKNEIRFDSNEDLIKAFKKLGHPEGVENQEFSLSWIVPYPSTKEECIKKYGELCVIKESEIDKAGIEIDEKIPWLNWYNFQCTAWGCKWDVSEAWIGTTSIYFDTPWSPPEPAIKKLAEILDDINFYFCYSEEQGPIYNGEFYHDTNSEDSWNEFDRYSDEAYKMYNQLWGETYIVLEDGNYHSEYDEEVFEAYDGIHWFDFSNFEKYEDLAKQYHESYGFDFDDWIINIYQDAENEKNIKEEVEKFKLFLMKTIGFYKPCWSDPTADPREYKTNHVYEFVSSFDEGKYVESFEETK
jgi:hypothetical protein